MAVYSSSFAKFLFYFDLWGSMSQFNKSANQSHSSFLIFSLHILLASISSVIIIEYLLRPTGDELGTANDTFKFIAFVLTYWLSIFELYLKRRTQNGIWELMSHIDRQLCSHHNFILAKYNIKFAAYSIAVILINLSYLHRILSAHQVNYVHFWTVYVLMELMLQHRSFYYLFYLELIAYELQIIQNELDKINECTNHPDEFIQKFHRNRFKWVRQYYDSIHELCTIIHNVFSWSHVAVLLLPFHTILLDINWMYWKVFNGYQLRFSGKRCFRDSMLCFYDSVPFCCRVRHVDWAYCIVDWFCISSRIQMLSIGNEHPLSLSGFGNKFIVSGISYLVSDHIDML